MHRTHKSCVLEELKRMAKTSEECSCCADMKDVDSFVLSGVERIALNYAGCQKCPSTWEREPYYEISMKERKKYPLSTHVHHIPSNNNNFCIASHPKVSKNNDCQTQDLDYSAITQADAHELENLIKVIESYASSLKSKLKTYKENEST